MFLWIISVLFSSYALILWKKALSFNCPNNLFRLLWLTFWIIFSIIFINFWYNDFSWLTLNIWILIFLATIISYIRILIWQYVYKREKISTLTPYENINKIISIIFSFLIFWHISIESFLITLFAWFILIWFSINLKTLKIPKFLNLFFINQLLLSFNTIIIWYFLTQITAIDYYILYNLAFLIIALPLVIKYKEYLNLKKLPKTFYKNRFWDSLISDIGTIIMFFIITDMWLTIWILFSYLYVWITLFLSFFILKDKPSKKDIILTIILSILVWIGYSLR